MGNFPLLGLVLGLVLSTAAAAQGVVNVYNWSDYVAPDTLKNFTKATGIKVVYDVYDANETLEAKVMAGGSGYDVIFPSVRPNGARMLKSGALQTLNRKALPNFSNLDAKVLASITDVDANNAYLAPYMWGTTGIGYNVAKVEAALGKGARITGWEALFDPAISGKLASCGIAMLDDEPEGFAAALFFLGKDPNAAGAADIQAVQQLWAKVRKNIKYFHSSQYINDLANGDICVAVGYNGDVAQARNRADEAKRGVAIQYVVPKQGAVRWVDAMAVPKDAPNAANAHKFINYILDAKVSAAITNYVSYASANVAARKLIDPKLASDSSLFPPAAVEAKLKNVHDLPPAQKRLRVRAWTRIKSGT
jgi:putrescine transport system substrate-binding protein